MTTKTQCSFCAKDELKFLSESEDFQFMGANLSVVVEYAICQHCGEEMILTEQIKRNDMRWLDLTDAHKLQALPCAEHL